MLKFAMIIGLLYMGYRLISKPNTESIESRKEKLLDEDDFTDYEEIE